MLFAKYGPVAGVKVMWRKWLKANQSCRRNVDFRAARNEAPIMGSMNRRGQNGFTGFVLFMKRKDAEKAIQELEGVTWSGTVLKLGWSRPMPLPARAAYGAFQSIRLCSIPDTQT